MKKNKMDKRSITENEGKKGNKNKKNKQIRKKEVDLKLNQKHGGRS